MIGYLCIVCQQKLADIPDLNTLDLFSAEDASLVGYFSLAVKPISVRAARKKLLPSTSQTN
jgi:hypothetical protein